MSKIKVVSVPCCKQEESFLSLESHIAIYSEKQHKSQQGNSKGKGLVGRNASMRSKNRFLHQSEQQSMRDADMLLILMFLLEKAEDNGQRLTADTVQALKHAQKFLFIILCH